MHAAYRWMSLTGTLAAVCLGGGSVAAPCDAALTSSLHTAAHRVASMQISKPGQARVFAADGAEYTAGAVRRMTSVVRLAEQACNRDDAKAAAAYIEDIPRSLRTPAE